MNPTTSTFQFFTTTQVQGPGHSSWRRFRLPRFALAVVVGLLLLTSGCQPTEAIRVYQVKKQLPGSRMLGAIIPRGEEAWFFKLTGPESEVAAVVPAFEQLVGSVSFAEGPQGEPEWNLPTGWNRAAGDAMRFATLKIPAPSGELECTVSKLPRKDPSLDEYLLANINRWRGQMKLPPLTVSDLSRETKKLSLAKGGLEATLVNLLGDLKPGGMGAAPFAGGALPPGGGRPPAAAAESSPVTYSAPAAWTLGEKEISRGGISVRRDAAYEVREGDRRVEITITKLPSAAGATLPNINRWRGQIGLGEWTSEQFAQEKKSLPVGSAAGDYVQFTNNQQTILGVIAEREGLTWFVKLQGDQQLAEQERARFEEFAQSLRWN